MAINLDPLDYRPRFVTSHNHRSLQTKIFARVSVLYCWHVEEESQPRIYIAFPLTLGYLIQTIIKSIYGLKNELLIDGDDTFTRIVDCVFNSRDNILPYL